MSRADPCSPLLLRPGGPGACRRWCARSSRLRGCGCTGWCRHGSSHGIEGIRGGRRGVQAGCDRPLLTTEKQPSKRRAAPASKGPSPAPPPWASDQPQGCYDDGAVSLSRAFRRVAGTWYYVSIVNKTKQVYILKGSAAHFHFYIPPTQRPRICSAAVTTYRPGDL